MNQFVPKLFDCMKGYSKEQFVKDVIAGIIVAIIALPLSIALALASGVGPEQGIYTAIFAGFVISFLGGSRVQIAGPTAAFATIVAGIVAEHQMEGLVVDKGITLCDLQGMLDRFVQALFGPEVKTRLCPSYFPFTEPSVEVDVSCFECHGKGCPLCKHTGWIEVLGGGVVNRKVLENCNIDPDEYSGFAFGIGIERIAMLKYGINNIGLMFENNLEFLKQFHE